MLPKTQVIFKISTDTIYTLNVKGIYFPESFKVGIPQ